MFSLLNLFRHYNDVLMSNLDRSMTLNQRNLLSYFAYIKSRHPLMKRLLMLINLIRIAQIPMELIVAKLAKGKRELFVLVVELSKFIIKFGIWRGSGWRPVPKQFSISLERREDPSSSLESDRVKRMEDKMDQLNQQLKTNQTREPLKSYLKGHKSNALTLQPNLIFSPCTEWNSWSRELAHLIRPSVYALSLLIVAKHGGGGTRKKWIPLIVSLTLDLYSKWPELSSTTNTNTSGSTSTIESEERSRRLLDLLYYPLRSPLYNAVTSEFLDSIEEKIGAVPLLSPVVETIKVYRKLCENVYFYTSAS